MKIFISVLILIFSFQSWIKADDIKDFEIEGISIGSNALDFVKLDKIRNGTNYHYKSKKYGAFYLELENSIYDGLQLDFEDNGKYIIEGVAGKIFYENNFMENCLKQEKKILKDLKETFGSNSKYIDNGIISHEFDVSGKSKGSWHTFELLDNSGVIYLECMDWADDIDFADNLKISIISSKFINFLNTAYE